MERRVGLLFGLGTLTLVALLWFLLDEPTRGAEPRAVRHGDRPADVERVTDTLGEVVDRAEPRALSGGVAPPPAETPPADDDAPPAPAPVVASLRGRVVDPDGVPLPGARVTYVPAARHASLFGGDGGWPYDLGILPSAVSDAGGRFALDVPWTGNASTGGWPHGPDLILEHTDFATTAVRCAAAGADTRELGDLLVERGGWVFGRVVDERGVPLAGVDVATVVRAPRLPDDRVPYRGALEMALRTPTDPGGRFRSPGLMPGDVRVEIAHPGYAHVSLVTLDGEAAIRSAPGAELDLGEIVLARGLGVSGSVTDEHGAPVADAEIVVSPRDQAEAFTDYAHPDTLPWEFGAALDDDRSARGRSDAAGRFHIQGLHPGSVAVYARAPGSLIGKRAPVAAGSDQAHVVLPAGGELVLELRDAATHAPLNDVQVEVWRQAFNAQAELPLETLGDGRVRATLVGPGEHLVSLRKPGYATALGRLHGLASGASRTIAFELHREGALIGRVVDETGAPIEGVSVWVTDPGGDGSPFGDGPPADDGTTVALFPAEGRDDTDADGRFRVGTLAPGTLELELSAPDRVRQNRIHTVVLEPSETRDLGEFVLAAAGHVEVVAREPDGSPSPGQQVSLERLSDGKGGTGNSTDADGRATLTQLAAGDYVLRTVRHDDLAVRVEAGETTQVELVLRAPPELFGRVTLRGEPAGGVRVFVREDDARPIWGRMIAERTAHSDASGRYELTLPSAGAFHVSVRSAANTVLQSRHDFAWDEQRRLDFAFDGAALGGTVHAGDDGRPLENIGVEARPVAVDGALQRAVTRSDAAGNWRFDELSPGAYTLRAWDPAFAFLDAGPVDTGTDDVALVLQPGAVLHGTLTRPGVEIVPDDTPLRLEHLDGVELRDREGEAESEAGAYRFHRLPAGRYRLFVGAPDAVLLETTVELAAGEQRRLDLTLPP